MDAGRRRFRQWRDRTNRKLKWANLSQKSKNFWASQGPRYFNESEFMKTDYGMLTKFIVVALLFITLISIVSAVAISLVK